MNTYGYALANPMSYIDQPDLWVGVDDAFTGPVDEIIVIGGLAIAASLGSDWAQHSLDSLTNWVMNQNDGSESKPSNCPSGTLPIDKAQKKLGLDKDGVHDIKDGVGAGPRTWTGYCP